MIEDILQQNVPVDEVFQTPKSKATDSDDYYFADFDKHCFANRCSSLRAYQASFLAATTLVEKISEFLCSRNAGFGQYVLSVIMKLFYGGLYAFCDAVKRVNGPQPMLESKMKLCWTFNEAVICSLL